jgi:hypothetical protein
VLVGQIKRYNNKYQELITTTMMMTMTIVRCVRCVVVVFAVLVDQE